LNYFRESHSEIGDGPQTDLVNGKADIHTQFQGVDTQYSIHADDIPYPKSTPAPEERINVTSNIKPRVKTPTASASSSSSSFSI